MFNYKINYKYILKFILKGGSTPDIKRFDKVNYKDRDYYVVNTPSQQEFIEFDDGSVILKSHSTSSKTIKRTFNDIYLQLLDIDEYPEHVKFIESKPNTRNSFYGIIQLQLLYLYLQYQLYLQRRFKFVI